jgi:hypothetical protein
MGLANLGSESETCVGSRVRLVGLSISFEKNFYRLPFTPPLSGSSYQSFNWYQSRLRVLIDSNQSKIQGWRTRNGVWVLHTSMAAFLCGKGQILWDVTVDTGYVQPKNFLAPGSRDIFDANNKAVDYLFRALCQPEFDRVHTEHLACRIWSVLKEAHVGNAQVQARMYATYRERV